jgi:mono/diheme cytochrome c family protein
MARRLAPLVVLVVVSLAVFGLAEWHPFSPSVPAAATAPTGNAARGAAIFATSCAGCHGADATGGVGPPLRGSGLTAVEVTAVVASGRGVMPAGIVTGQDAADVAAHVASIAK